MADALRAMPHLRTVTGTDGPDRESALARGLGLPEPGGEEWISQRLTRLRPDQGAVPHILLAGEPWTVAGPDDPVEEIPSPCTP
ncbi:regulatory protein [Streptomyces venezuelae]|uniref:NaeI family type II restriction endonuclease n=1 Tax=Streptomyces gardneri TaxID=66892 RepID=UPI0006BC131D|nr:NaeI family type II restriction endonuclease [Streptomyces gardneri]ALO13427.1 regulatory protein [Streptomyces venezuelae]QPK50062.1 hypothetical protein H4W23_39335 [Streptomyces gardneri]WRK41643.1 NaeI family type II restriction endonuclease [Streptomyces venezuelae]CUM35856.1 hypothetical protein BN2537_677 [Streptomyces venezuelae]